MDSTQIRDTITQLAQTLDASQVRTQIRDHIVTYLSGLLAESGGELTAYIRQQCDQLYDAVPGVGLADTIAGALHINSGELRTWLGKDIQVPCAECNQPVTVHVARKIGGYSRPSSVYCSVCKAARRNRSTEYWETQLSERQAEIAERRRQINVEIRMITQSLADSLQGTFGDKINNYLSVWKNGILRTFVHGDFPAFYYHMITAQIGCNCMICGERDSPLSIFVRRRIVIDEQDRIDVHLLACAGLLNMNTDDNRPLPISYEIVSDLPALPEWPDVIDARQILLRMHPYMYWQSAALYPVSQLPLVVLCSNCERLVDQTHIKFVREDK